MAFTIKQNDTRPFFVVALKDDYGEATEAPVNLTTASTAVFNMRAHAGTAVKVNRAGGTITNAATGEVTYKWEATDTDTVGTFDAEIEIGWADGKVETFPSDSYWVVSIVDDIA